MHVTIRRPKKEDIPKIKNVFHDTISYAFEADGIADREDGIAEEVVKSNSPVYNQILIVMEQKHIIL